MRRNDVIDVANISLTDEMSSARQEPADIDVGRDGILLALTLDRSLFVAVAVVTLSQTSSPCSSVEDCK